LTAFKSSTIEIIDRRVPPAPPRSAC
jgi:hypothetical protein